MDDMKNKISTYSRILIDVEYGDFDSNIEVGKYSKLKLQSLDKVIEDYLEFLPTKIPDLTVLDRTPIKIEKKNNKNFLIYTYTRKLESNPNVKVIVYTCFNKSYLIRITISYRINEYEYWQDSIQYFLDNNNLTG